MTENSQFAVSESFMMHMLLQTRLLKKTNKKTPKQQTNKRLNPASINQISSFSKPTLVTIIRQMSLTVFVTFFQLSSWYPTKIMLSIIVVKKCWTLSLSKIKMSQSVCLDSISWLHALIFEFRMHINISFGHLKVAIIAGWPQYWVSRPLKI